MACYAPAHKPHTKRRPGPIVVNPVVEYSGAPPPGSDIDSRLSCGPSAADTQKPDGPMPARRFADAEEPDSSQEGQVGHDGFARRHEWVSV